MQFRNSLPKIVSILNSIAKWKDVEASTKAKGLMKSLQDIDTIVAIICLSDLLSCTQGLSKFLQKVNTDLRSAKNELDIALKLLNRRREKCDENFKNIFLQVEDLAKEL